MTPRRRLQREPDFTGARLASFGQVFVRHGLPGLMVALLLLLLPGVRSIGENALAPMFADPGRYLLWSVTILIALSLYVAYLDRGWRVGQLGWVLYLGALSFWEEWVFRVAVPYILLEGGVAMPIAIIGTNLAFGVVHYFTLRWRWYWCVGAFLGGLALSRQMALHGDLLWLVGLHWVATFINTPRAPGAEQP